MGKTKNSNDNEIRRDMYIAELVLFVLMLCSLWLDCEPLGYVAIIPLVYIIVGFFSIVSNK